jgi:hypothetical protein
LLILPSITDLPVNMSVRNTKGAGITQIKQQIYDKFAWLIEDADEPGNEAVDFKAIAHIQIDNATPVMLCVKQ